MAWQVAFEAPRRIVSVSYAGHVTSQDIRSCVERVIELMRAENTNLVFMDIGGVTRIDAGTVEILSLPELYRSLGLTGSFRQAIVAPPGSAALDAAAFYETVCLNRGHQVRLFQERDRALEWLVK